MTSVCSGQGRLAATEEVANSFTDGIAALCHQCLHFCSWREAVEPDDIFGGNAGLYKDRRGKRLTDRRILGSGTSPLLDPANEARPTRNDAADKENHITCGEARLGASVHSVQTLRTVRELC